MQITGCFLDYFIASFLNSHFIYTVCPAMHLDQVPRFLHVHKSGINMQSIVHYKANVPTELSWVLSKLSNVKE